MASSDKNEDTVSRTDVRQGQTHVGVRYVLIASLVLAAILGVVFLAT